jgi:thioredoxin
MRNNLVIGLTAITLLFYSCSEGQKQTGNTNLSATEFANKIKEQSNAVVLDVRTPQEYAKGHLPNALNYDWNGGDFENQVARLDKSKPVFVYCLSGARSAAAAKQMRSEGFQQVFELSGGIMKWRAANLPETTDAGMATSGMTKEQFNLLLNTDKLLLIDFYADWCAPCKEMKPYLDEIGKEMQDKLIVLRINTDDNQALCKELKVDTLPTLHLYINKTLAWAHTGLIGKKDIVRHLQ